MDVWISEKEQDTVRKDLCLLAQLLPDNDRFHWVPLSDDESARKVYARRKQPADGEGRLPRPTPCLFLECETLPQHIWPAATAMRDWLQKNATLLAGKRVLELGCGTGFLGFAASQYASSVVLTDISPVALALAEYTARCQDFQNCSFALLHWGRGDDVEVLKRHLGIEAFDVVIGSDVFYFHSTLKAGLQTARAALTDGSQKASGFMLCGSAVRSDRMEHDLGNTPAAYGFESDTLALDGNFRLYMWKPIE